jgi:arsenate reductase
MTITVFGIPNCDTVKKAREWLRAHGVRHVFHNFRADGLEPSTLQRWVEALGWETVLNRNATTFRALPAGDKEGLATSGAVRLMLAHPTLIKRPVLEAPKTLLVGFKPEAYVAAFR